MAFAKAVAQQAKLKIAVYGKQGSGKTLTSLMVAEGLAKQSGKRIAYIDTEFGTDFYTIAIPERTVHPEAFDFDRICTRSITEVVEEVEKLDTNVYGVLVLDSITHLWEAAREAYKGKINSNGSIPIQAWGSIKRPYKRLMALFLNKDVHAILCGREGVVMEESGEGEMKVTGQKMKAEGETPYEPHICARMIQSRQDSGAFTISAFFEKDRSGILTGKTVDWPSYETFAPLVACLTGIHQGTMPTSDEYAERDASAIEAEKEREERDRLQLFDAIHGAIARATSLSELKSAWELTKGKKGKLGEDLFARLETAKEANKQTLMGAVN